MTNQDLPAEQLRVPGVAFLLSQLGFESSRLWRERLEPLGIDPRHAVLLRHVAAEEGRSQQVLGAAMRLPGSRMVALVDELERQGLLERRRSAADRRVNGLFLTAKGHQALDAVMSVSAEHEADLCRGLSQSERQELIALLNRLVIARDLAAGVHPGVSV